MGVRVRDEECEMLEVRRVVEDEFEHRNTLKVARFRIFGRERVGKLGVVVRQADE